MNQTNCVPRGDLRLAESVMKRLPRALEARGVAAAFEGWMVTRYAGLSLLFGVVDVSRVERLETYTSAALVHQMSTALGGLPVYLSNASGLRYVVLLNQKPRLPRRVDFGQVNLGRALLGLRCTGEAVAVPWNRLGHLLVAGMTGSGKSGMLRLLAYQALAEGMQLLISDVNRTTLPMLAGHPALLAPMATTPAEAAGLIERALGECDNRAELYGQVEGYPESLDEYNLAATTAEREPLPRVLVILDECSEMLQAMGGSRGSLGESLARLGWMGRKFGVHVVFAAQEFTKDLIGPVREQVSAAICFRVRSGQMAARVGCAGAEKLPEGRPGLAISDRWGPIQAYYLDKALLLSGNFQPASMIPADQRSLAERALQETGGKMSLAVLEGWGMSERRARSLVESWERRGWLRRGENRARYITEALKQILEPGLKTGGVV
jgi:hypothetical protein